tara:strand:- start:835 stop:1779 length:945 start_codon:yes stop_codon:yes gene_type:complete
MITTLPTALTVGFAGLVALLIAGSVAAFVLPRLSPGKWDDLGPRMTSWWVICLLVGGSLLLGWQVFTVLFTLISFIALKEYLTLAPTRRDDRLVVLFAYVALLVSYSAIWIDNYAYFLVTIPVYIFLATAVLLTLSGRTDGFLATAGIMQWGMVVCVFNLGHVAFLMRVPEAEVPQAGPAGLVFFLIFITQLNDVTQYIWGKLLGRHKISPHISPNKTWEGAIGGFATTGIAFVILAPYFTPLTFWPSVWIGATLPVLGFFGDITMSAIKRDLGVKDTSRLIPGHGGALDRLDSLMFTAPWYFHMLAYFALERF